MLWIFLSILGIVGPYSQVVPWVAEHGLDLPGFFQAAFVNRPAATHAIDLYLTAMFLLVAALQDPRRPRAAALGAVVAGTLGIGVCFGAPLYFYFRGRNPAA